MKLTMIAAGETTPTAANTSATDAARLYAGATLDVAMTVVSKRLRVFVFNCDATGVP